MNKYPDLIDCHCHVLPGIDDGPADFETARLLLQQCYDEGVRTIVATSHYRLALWKASRKRYERAFKQAKLAAAEVSQDLVLVPGNEIYCEEGILHRLLQGDCLTIGADSVMLEFSYQSELRTMLRYVDIVSARGYQPIVAHVERYDCLRKRGAIDELRDMGCLVQVNTDSILGENGFSERLFARRLLKQEKIDLIGSDCHDPEKRPCRFRRCAEYIRKKCAKTYADALLTENPQRLLSE